MVSIRNFRDIRAKLKSALSSDSAMFALTGQRELENIKWAYEILDKDEKENAEWMAGVLRLDKYKGKYFTAWYYTQGKIRKELMGKYKESIFQSVKNQAAKLGISKKKAEERVVAEMVQKKMDKLGKAYNQSKEEK